MSRFSSGNIEAIGYANVDDFVMADEDTKIKWSLGLKKKLERGQANQNFQKQKSEDHFIVRLQGLTYTLTEL